MRRASSPPPPRLLPAVQGFALLSAALLLAWLPFAGPLASGCSRAWRGYQVLLVRGDAADEALARVAARLGPGVVTEQSATVDFWDFTGLARAPVASLDARLDASDPRYDAYLRGAPRLFSATVNGRSWRVAYLPARACAPLAALRLAAVLGVPFRGSWRLLELDPLEKMLSLLALAALAFLMTSSVEKVRRTVALLGCAGALCWVPFLLSGGTSRCAIASLLFVIWFPLMDLVVVLHGWDRQLIKEARRPLVVYGSAAVALLAVGMASSGFSPAAAIACLGPMLAPLFLLAAVARFWGKARRPRKRRRSRFEPVPIVRPVVEGGRITAGVILLAIACVTLVSLVPLARRTSLPAPRAIIAARDFSWRSLARLDGRRTTNSLPDYSLLVAHEAYQEALPFGRAWRMPSSDERVYRREFVAVPRSAAMVARWRVVKTFDSTWLASVGRRGGPDGIEALFLSQGRPVAVAERGPGWMLLRESPVTLLALCLLFSWLARERGAGHLIRSVLLRFNGGARRNQAS